VFKAEAEALSRLQKKALCIATGAFWLEIFGREGVGDIGSIDSRMVKAFT
jgi:hypothetical protein